MWVLGRKIQKKTDKFVLIIFLNVIQSKHFSDSNEKNITYFYWDIWDKKKTLRLCTVHKGLKKTIRALKLNRAYIILRSF